MLSFSNEELKTKPALNIGDVFLCSKCGQLHEVHGSRKITIDENGNPVRGEETNEVMFYICGDSTFLAGVDGKNVM